MNKKERTKLTEELASLRLSWDWRFDATKLVRAREILERLGVRLLTARPISVVVFDDPEVWLRCNLPDLDVDNVSSVYRSSPLNLDGLTEYTEIDEDKPEPQTKWCSLNDHLNGLQLLCNEVGDKLFVGGIKSPLMLLDAGNWDVEVVDAYFQFVMLGKVIYG